MGTGTGDLTASTNGVHWMVVKLIAPGTKVRTPNGDGVVVRAFADVEHITTSKATYRVRYDALENCNPAFRGRPWEKWVPSADLTILKDQDDN